METKQFKSEPESSHRIIIKPVGIIENDIHEPFLVSGKDGLKQRKGDKTSMDDVHKKTESISRIIINEDLDGILDGIDGYSHLTVLFWGHVVPEEGRSLTKVHPIGREDFPLVGLFGTCSPARPNPVLMTVARLIRREGNVLEVTGLDAIDGSPIIDIKPYVREFYPQEDVRVTGWMQKIVDEVAVRRGSAQAKK